MDRNQSLEQLSENFISTHANSLSLSVILNPLRTTTDADENNDEDNRCPEDSQRQTTSANASNAANLSSVTPVSTLNQLYPFQIMACSLLYAWIYTITPTENFWIYNCLKQQLWAFLCLAAYIELQEICLPDIPDDLYILCYVVGFWTPILFNIAVYEPSLRVF